MRETSLIPKKPKSPASSTTSFTSEKAITPLTSSYRSHRFSNASESSILSASRRSGSSTKSNREELLFLYSTGMSDLNTMNNHLNHAKEDAIRLEEKLKKALEDEKRASEKTETLKNTIQKLNDKFLLLKNKHKDLVPIYQEGRRLHQNLMAESMRSAHPPLSVSFFEELDSFNSSSAFVNVNTPTSSGYLQLSQNHFFSTPSTPVGIIKSNLKLPEEGIDRESAKIPTPRRVIIAPEFELPTFSYLERDSFNNSSSFQSPAGSPIQETSYPTSYPSLTVTPPIFLPEKRSKQRSLSLLSDSYNVLLANVDHTKNSCMDLRAASSEIQKKIKEATESAEKSDRENKKLEEKIEELRNKTNIIEEKIRSLYGLLKQDRSEINEFFIPNRSSRKFCILNKKPHPPETLPTLSLKPWL